MNIPPQATQGGFLSLELYFRGEKHDHEFADWMQLDRAYCEMNYAKY